MARRGRVIGYAAAMLCALAMGAGGCGGDDDAGTRPSEQAPSADPQGKADPNKDPFAATCDEFLNSPDLYSQGTVKLSRRVRVHGASQYHVLLRFRNAITDLCKKADRADYRPARDAIAAVKRGEYKTEGGRAGPQGRPDATEFGVMSDQPVHADEVEQMRAVYFRKTRLTAGVVYVVFALMAVGVGAAAYSTARMPAIIGGLVGFALGVPVFILEGRIPISAQAKRGLLVPVAVLGAVGASFLFDALSGGAEAAVSGATAGFLAAMIVGLAYFRRRLARDDEMLLRQKRLGFDPEHPWRWLR